MESDPNFATKQAGGFLALLGWSDRPIAGSSAEVENAMLRAADHAKSAAAHLTYKVLSDGPWALVNVRDYEVEGKPERDVGMDVIATRNCIFSIKFSGQKAAGDDDVWAPIDAELERIRRVIANHEAGRPWALSGAK